MAYMIRNQIRFFKFILNHPLTRWHRLKTLKDWLFWQIGSRLVHGDVRVPFVNHTFLWVHPGMTGATLNIYVGLAEFEDMAFVAHFLRPDDVFCDVGANVGVYTIMASGVCGAASISIEPIQTTFEKLKQNVHLNYLDQLVRLIHAAVGQEKGSIIMTGDLDTVNHVVIGTKDSSELLCEVPVFTMDDLVSDSIPQLIKIDVEGFEANVIEGAKRTLSSERLMAVIMELNGSGERYGISDEHVHRLMLEHDFSTFRYDPFGRELIDLENSTNSDGVNTLYIKNNLVPRVKERIKKATPFIVKGIKI
jgi:FkbM family methyltransferase